MESLDWERSSVSGQSRRTQPAGDEGRDTAQVNGPAGELVQVEVVEQRGGERGGRSVPLPLRGSAVPGGFERCVDRRSDAPQRLGVQLSQTAAHLRVGARLPEDDATQRGRGVRPTTEPFGQPGQRLRHVASHRLDGQSAQLLDAGALADEGNQDVDLRREVVEHQPLRDLRPFGDARCRRAVVPGLGEQVLGRVEDAFARALGLPATACRRPASVVLGVVLGMTALWSLYDPGAIASEYSHAVLGVLMFITPWVFEFTDTTVAAFTSWILGLVAVGLLAVPESTKAHRQLAH